MAYTVNIARAKRMAFKSLLAGIVPMLWGPPAIGKSDIVKQIAEENNLLLIDERLSDCDPTDLKGFPRIDPATGKATYVPMSTFPVAGDDLPAYRDKNGKEILIDDPDKPGQKMVKRYNGWLLFLDELTNADDDVKKAAYKLILDRMVGPYKLHDNCAIVAAGNEASDGALASELGTALQSRVLHVAIEIDFKTWMAYAIDKGIDQRIRDYNNFKEGAHLYTFRPDHTDKTYASPRTWFFADRLIKAHGLDDEDMFALLAGELSDGVATEFMQFCTVYATLPKIDDIIKNPDWAPIPSDLSSQFAICGMVSAALSIKTAPKLMIYILRMPWEFQIVVLADAIKRDASLRQDRQIIGWAMKHGHELF
jgi:hypothetical protein